MQQATVNLFADMGVQPATLQSGLVAGTASADSTPAVRDHRRPPAARPSRRARSRRSPAPPATPAAARGRRRGVRRRWRDVAPGDRPRDVDLRLDAGDGRRRPAARPRRRRQRQPRCRRAAGRDRDPARLPVHPLRKPRCRRSRRRTTGSRSRSASASARTSPAPSPPSAITGARADRGTHARSCGRPAASRWRRSTFTGEGGVRLAAGLAVGAGRPDGGYDLRRLLPLAGRLVCVRRRLLRAAFDAAPLHAPAAPRRPNGVYKYGGGFPTETYQAANYWADVVFVPADATPPVVTAVAPPSGAEDVDRGTAVTATFDEPLTASSITASAFGLRDPAAARSWRASPMTPRRGPRA